MKEITQKEKRQRRFMAFIPIVALPFVCMLFWTLGGGFDARAQKDQRTSTGLNTALPDPRFDEDPAEGKMSFYQQAAQDSQKLQEQISNDPFYRTEYTPDSQGREPYVQQSPYTYSAQTYAGYTPTGDPNVDKINQRLSSLYGQWNTATRQSPQPAAEEPGLDRVQALLQAVGQSSGQDPEMAQLDGMLEKILDIQDPQRAREKMRDRSLKNRKQVYTVSSTGKENEASTLVSGYTPSPGINGFPGRSSGSGFYEWSDQTDDPPADANAVSAVIQQTATVAAGATLKLRLTDDIYIGGTLIKKGTFVYGTCALSADRLTVTIGSVRYKNSLYAVNLSAYDMDGIEGIYMPGAISRDVAKNSAQDAVQGVDYYSLDKDVTSQAASVGIQAAKSLLSKKARLVRVTVKAGYQVLLKDANSQE